MFSKLKLSHKGGKLTPADPVVTPGQPPSIREIYHSRKHFGVNFGSCFLLEKWIYHGLFIESEEKGGGIDCELKVVSGLVKKYGVEETRNKFEKHWQEYVNEDDWQWLVDHNVNSIRLAIGYWNINGGAFTDGFKFEKYKAVYENSWNIIKTQFIEVANKYNISVVLDIHGVPYGANKADHSGEPGQGKFWENQTAELQMSKAMGFIAEDFRQYENIAGISIVNEADFTENIKQRTKYYSAAINEIRSKDTSVPIVISDCWWTDQWVRWIQEHQDDGRTNLSVLIDHHSYRCFDDKDTSKEPRQIIDDLPTDILTNLTNESKGVDIIIGEYSCVLDTKSWDKIGNRNRDGLVCDYGKRQCEIMQARTCGTYFWTFKFEAGNGGEWDFKTMSNKGALSIPSPIQNPPGKDEFEHNLQQAYDGHVNYWHSADPNENYQHDRFKDGFTTAWADAVEFSKFNGSRIGRKNAWKQARLQEHIHAKGNSGFIWEWESGFDQGLAGFYAIVNN
ncbi:putative glycosyl hydrolase [Spathaspora sp. JA1]|nr:putative glycosyl hydrolase [Spathaspora sp. JA1]